MNTDFWGLFPSRLSQSTQAQEIHTQQQKPTTRPSLYSKGVGRGSICSPLYWLRMRFVLTVG
jgi:hypothetical protein